MTIDTTVVNGRFVCADGIDREALSIDDGIILDTVELEDVWRTVDAAGYFVLPGIVHGGELISGKEQILARHGVTTLVTPIPEGRQIAGGFDLLPSLNLDELRSRDQLKSEIESGTRIFDASQPRPEFGDLLSNAIVRARGDAAAALDWCGEAIVIRVVEDTNETILEDSTIEIPVNLLRDSDDSTLWEFVGDPDRKVIVTADDAEFPVLHFLFDVGRRHGVAVDRIVDVISRIPADVYGLAPNKGQLVPGSDGDLVVFDPDTYDQYREEQYPGRVIFSLRRGEIFFYNGELHAEPGDGHLIRR